MTASAPRRPRHDGWTPERQHAFLAELAAGSSVTTAASAVGLSKRGAYKHRLADPAFDAAWAAAQTASAGAIERTALRIAVEGWTDPVTYRGRVVGQRQRHDTRLLLGLLQQQERQDARAERRAERDAERLFPRASP